MKFTKTTLAATLLTALPISAFAAEELTFYGKANVTIQSSDDGSESVTDIKSNASRLGVKGSHAVEGGLEVVYQAEFEVQIDDGDKDGQTISQRNIYVGLKGDFGTVFVGKHDTALKKSQGKIDLFSDLEGDIKNLWKGENRLSNSLMYKSPKFNGFAVNLGYIASETEAVDDGISLAVSYGDEALKKSDFYAAVAVDSEVNGYDVTRLAAQGKLGAVVLGAMVQTQEKLSNGEELDGVMVSAKYPVGKVTLKGQVQTAEVDGGDDRSGFTVGADYKLSKQAKVFAFYTTFDMDSAADEDYLAVGLEYKF